jgi:hypothetical protein
MTTRIKFSLNLYWPLFIALAVSVCAVEIWIVSSAFFAQNPSALAFGITLDIVIGIPALYYFLVVRKKRAPAITVIPITILTFFIAGFILPAAQQNYLDWVKKIIPLFELVVLGFIIVKIRTIVKIFRDVKQREIYFIDNLGESCRRALGNLPILGIILTEFSLLYFAFAGWFKKFENHDSNNIPFSYHRKNGYAAIIGVIIMILITETLALHILLQHWNLLAAWIFTGISIYGLFWLLGDYQAMRLHPIVLSQEFLFIRTGLRWRATLPLANIAAIDKFKAREKRIKDYLGLSIFGDPRLLICCKQPVVVRGLFGIKREVCRIGLTVDDEKLFLEALQQRLNVNVKPDLRSTDF